MAERNLYLELSELKSIMRLIQMGAIVCNSLAVVADLTDRLCRCGAPVQYLSHSASFHSLEKYAPPNAGTKHLEASALRISLSDLKAAFNSSDEIRERILEMAQEQALSMSQILADTKR
jgi:hypothetical protein